MERAIFIGGVPRSGTTLLRVMLDSHSRIHCGTELRVLPGLADLWQLTSLSAQPLLSAHYRVDERRLRDVYADLSRGCLEPAWRASGKPRAAEKTPWNLRVFAALGRLFPEARLIHVVRDGRDVVASRLERDRAEQPMVSSHRQAAQRAAEWVEGMEIARGLRGDDLLAGRYLELRYEELVTNPVRILRRLCELIEEAFEATMLEFHHIERELDGTEEWSAESVRRPVHTESIGRFRRTLTGDELAIVLQVAGPTLVKLGYLGEQKSCDVDGVR
jgi:hypothetical protein